MEPVAIVVIVAALAIVGALVLCFFLNTRALRKSFFQEFGVDVPADMDICKIKRPRPRLNFYELGFPHWAYENKDGSRDKRKANNPVVYPKSVLIIGEYQVLSESPIGMTLFVDRLRSLGVPIEHSQLEKEKADAAKERNRLLCDANDISSIMKRYEQDPYGFERFCAGLFDPEKCRAIVTSSSGDGGYDIVVEYDSGKRAIAECKCFSEAKVGRPMIQKLVGANIEAKADKMIFFTTTAYTKQALEYAESVNQSGMNINLIDGKGLLVLLRGRNDARKVKERSKVVSDCELTWDDIRAHYPPDWKD